MRNSKSEELCGELVRKGRVCVVVGLRYQIPTTL